MYSLQKISDSAIPRPSVRELKHNTGVAHTITEHKKTLETNELELENFALSLEGLPEGAA
jgi:hypothetical protein